MAFGSFLKKLKNVVAPVIGTAVAGPLGGIVAGGLAGAFDEGNKFKNILKGAGTAAAGIGVSKGLSALKGAVTAGGSGITEPASGMLAKKVGTDAASELAKKQITTPAVKALGNPAVTGSISLGTNTARTAARSSTVAEIADNAAGRRFQDIVRTMGQQRYDAAGGGSAGMAAQRSFVKDEVIPSMMQEVRHQQGFSGSLRQTDKMLEDLAREQIQTSAAENMARGGQPLVSFPSSAGGRFDAAVAQNTRQITPPSSNLTSRTVSSPISSGSFMPTPNTPTPIGAGGTMDRLRELLSGVGGFAKENPEVAMGIAQGLGSAFSTSPQEREIEYMKELAAARARMLAPLYAQYSREFMG